ncbi:hypothetical protein Cgig2_028517 [Carnegiea gigantea]|uniref:DUF4283 domain-containing protein n=1 Tax=Carnegiea gigantea TaxID=171969 RepID=A0A9Q1GLK7_9CARY|nr:hypothetical protein Cgig2_028517 [Carnegiea gigantea]
MDIDKVLLVRKGVFLIRFNNMDDRIKVLKKGWYFFDRKLFITKAWNEDLSLDTSNLHSIPIWVRFPEMDIKFWGLDSLSKLGSMLGIPIKTDRTTRDKSALGFTGLLIEMPFEGPFPDHIDFINDGDRASSTETQVVPPLEQTEHNVPAATREEGQGQEGFVSPRRHAPKTPTRDFNAVLHPGEQIGGEDIQHGEVVDFANCLEQCELQEVPSYRAFFMWTNKTIWSQIDRALVNCHWHQDIGLTQAICTPEGLSDHTLIKIQLLTTPKPKSSFNFMTYGPLIHSSRPLLKSILTEHTQAVHYSSIPCSSNLHKDKFSDIHEQQYRTRSQLEAIQTQLHEDPQNTELIAEERVIRETYIRQSKQTWLNQGDHCTKLFFAKMRQRYMQTFIYQIKDDHGEMVEGFENVPKKLLGDQTIIRTLVDSNIMQTGACLLVEHQLMLFTPVTDQEIRQIIWSIPTCNTPSP